MRIADLEILKPKKIGSAESILSENADKLKDGKIPGLKGKPFIGFITNDFIKIGTGFIVIYEGKIYMVTASHNVN